MYNQSKTQCAAYNFFHLGGDSFCARVHVDDGTRAPLPTLFLVFSRATLQKLFLQASSFCLKQAPTLVAVTESRSTWWSKWCLATPFLNSFPCWSWSSGACSQSFQPTTQPNFSLNSPLLWEMVDFTRSIILKEGDLIVPSQRGNPDYGRWSCYIPPPSLVDNF